MGGLGWQELTIILIIVVIIFGAGKLPEIGGALGKGIKEFKTQANEDGTPTEPIAANTTTTTRREDGRVVETREMRADEI